VASSSATVASFVNLKLTVPQFAKSNIIRSCIIAKLMNLLNAAPIINSNNNNNNVA